MYQILYIYISSFNHPNNSLKWIRLLPHFTNEKTEVKRNYVTSPRPHSWEVAEPGLKPADLPDSRVSLFNSLPYGKTCHVYKRDRKA